MSPTHVRLKVAAVFWTTGCCEVAGEPVPVLRPGQRATDAGRADLQVPGAGDRVFDVEHGT